MSQMVEKMSTAPPVEFFDDDMKLMGIAYPHRKQIVIEPGFRVEDLVFCCLQIIKELQRKT